MSRRKIDENSIDEKFIKKVTDLQTESQNLTTQLADTVEKAKTNTTVASFKKEPIITLLDDDGRPEVWSILKDISVAKGVPFSIAVITGRLNKPDEHISVPQIRVLEDMGWEIMGHTYTHPTGGPGGLLNYAGDYSRLEYQIGSGCKDVLTDLGFNVTGFVYPQGGNDFDIREITKKHYDYAFAKIGFNDDALQDSTQLMRIAFGLSANLNPQINGNNEKSTLAYYKECVDFAISNNAWLTFMIHVNTHTPEQNQMLSDLIDYINSVNVKVLTARDAYKLHGNRYFAGDVESDNYFIVDKNNKPRISEGAVQTNYKHMLFSDFKPTLNVDTPVSGFPKNCRTAIYMTGNNALSNGFPYSGILYVDRFNNDSFSKREIRGYQDKSIYQSYWTGTSWSPFVKTYDSSYDKPTTNAVNAGTTPLGMTVEQRERPFTTKIMGTNKGGFARNKEGVLYTDATRGFGYDYQLYYELGSSRISTRSFVNDAWTDWVLAGGLQKYEYLKEWAVAVGTVGANSSKNYTVTSGMFILGNSLVVNPKFNVPDGLFYNARISIDGTAILTVYNMSTSSITCPTDTWMFRVLEN